MCKYNTLISQEISFVDSEATQGMNEYLEPTELTIMTITVGDIIV